MLSFFAYQLPIMKTVLLICQTQSCIYREIMLLNVIMNTL